MDTRLREKTRTGTLTPRDLQRIGALPTWGTKREALEIAYGAPWRSNKVTAHGYKSSCGLMAVHREYNSDRKRAPWVLTHCPTGLAWPGDYRTRKQAQLVGFYLLQCGINWDTDLDTIKDQMRDWDPGNSARRNWNLLRLKALEYAQEQGTK